MQIQPPQCQVGSNLGWVGRQSSSCSPQPPSLSLGVELHVLWLYHINRWLLSHLWTDFCLRLIQWGLRSLLCTSEALVTHASPLSTTLCTKITEAVVVITTSIFIKVYQRTLVIILILFDRVKDIPKPVYMRRRLWWLQFKIILLARKVIKAKVLLGGGQKWWSESTLNGALNKQTLHFR